MPSRQPARRRRYQSDVQGVGLWITDLGLLSSTSERRGQDALATAGETPALQEPWCRICWRL